MPTRLQHGSAYVCPGLGSLQQDPHQHRHRQHKHYKVFSYYLLTFHSNAPQCVHGTVRFSCIQNWGFNLTLNLVYDTGEYLRKNHKFWVWESQKLDFLYLSFDWTRSKIYWLMYTLCNCSNNQEVADKDDSVHVWEWDGSTTRLSSVSYRTIWYHDQYISIY